ncbi:hypothetical protein NliqN6_0992 [Naganishia liquefaciens]|uniref:Uncharacterized protein n=1 Tax=Naganishia liquefaciens TaxID=104408 RepID=A0A8H3TP14_9TREE|nr:hypothetical protein NliqN6_0992 [Naganishia liquefaciens]
MRILRTLPTALICCSITSSVTAVQWLPFDVKPNGKAVSDESVQETTNEHFRRDETGITAVVLPDPPVLETPPLAGPHSICDRVPIEAYLMTNNVLYEGRAIESMWLCIQDAEFTPESSARLDSALTGSAVAPRIDQMCIEYYAAQNRPWTDAHAAICRPVMLAAIRENTLYLLDERATAAPTTVAPTTAAPTTAAPSSTDKPTPIFPDPTPPPLDDSTSICDFVPVQARLSVDGVVIYEGIAIDGMCLCMQNGQFTSDSQVQLETALSGTYTTPRINQMCQDFYSALGRQYTDQDALDCPSAMSDILVANTLYILSQRSTACPYPANDFTPICGGDCAFICNPGFILCGDDAPRCVPLGTPVTKHVPSAPMAHCVVEVIFMSVSSRRLTSNHAVDAYTPYLERGRAEIVRKF